MKVFTLHGFMGGPQDFSFLSMMVASHDFHHLTLPGHLEAPLKNEQWEKCVEELAKQILDTSEGHDFYLLGYSMGGRMLLGVSEILTRQHCPQFKGLILESAHPGIANSQERQERFERDQQLLKSVSGPKSFDKFLRNWWGAPLFAGLNQHEDFERLVERRKHSDPRKLQAAMNLLSVGAQPDYEAVFQRQHFPRTLFLVGKLDQKYFDLAHGLAKGCAKISVSDFDCGHNIHFCEPRAFALAIDSWLSS